MEPDQDRPMWLWHCHLRGLDPEDGETLEAKEDGVNGFEAAEEMKRLEYARRLESGAGKTATQLIWAIPSRVERAALLRTGMQIAEAPATYLHPCPEENL